MTMQGLLVNRKVHTGARHLLGFIFILFGLNGFFQFIPVPPMPDEANQFMTALMLSKLLYLVKLLEIICGVMLMANLWVPLALVMLAPIVVNIFWFHAFLAPQGLAFPILLILVQAFLGYVYRDRFAPLFSKV